VSSGQGEGFFSGWAAAPLQGAAAAKRFCSIHDLEARFSVSWLCPGTGAARSGLYAWRQRQENPGSRAGRLQLITLRSRRCSSSTVASTDTACAPGVGCCRPARSGAYPRGQAHASCPAQAKPQGNSPLPQGSSSVCGATENLLQQDYSPRLPSAWARDSRISHQGPLA